MKHAEIVIIGGGVVGASVAFHLVGRGAPSVVILERETQQGLGSTGAATGGIRAQFETDVNILMSLYSLSFLREWDHDCDLDPKGYLFLATDDAQLAYLRRNIERQRELGVTNVEIVSAEDIAKIVPGMNCADVAGGSLGMNDGFINPLKMMRGFTEGALAGGARFESGICVQHLLTEGSRICGVRTSHGDIGCDAVVVCTGAHAAELALTAGVHLPVTPERRQIVWARTRAPLPPDLPMVIDLGTGFHFRPARDFKTCAITTNEVLFAYPDPGGVPCSDTSFDESFIARVYQKAECRAEFLHSSEVIRGKCRAGLYENTPDHHAILGGCEVEGLYFANGFSGHGVMHSPATGRALAEIILDGEASFMDVKSLSLSRFGRGELLREAAFI